jgi:hypothetical protein
MIKIPTTWELPPQKQRRCREGNTWKQFCRKLNTWRQEWLAGCADLESDDQEDGQNAERLSLALCDPSAHLYIVSDGGNQEKVGSYGFVIADATSEERLWQASGQAQGFDMSSYRAEAQGMLAGLHFLRIFVWYHCKAKAECKITHFCDNQALVIETIKHVISLIYLTPSPLCNAMVGRLGCRAAR